MSTLDSGTLDGGTLDAPAASSGTFGSGTFGSGTFGEPSEEIVFLAPVSVALVVALAPAAGKATVAAELAVASAATGTSTGQAQVGGSLNYTGSLHAQISGRGEVGGDFKIPQTGKLPEDPSPRPIPVPRHVIQQLPWPTFDATYISKLRQGAIVVALAARLRGTATLRADATRTQGVALPGEAHLRSGGTVSPRGTIRPYLDTDLLAKAALAADGSPAPTAGATQLPATAKLSATITTVVVVTADPLALQAKATLRADAPTAVDAGVLKLPVTATVRATARVDRFAEARLKAAAVVYALSPTVLDADLFTTSALRAEALAAVTTSGEVAPLRSAASLKTQPLRTAIARGNQAVTARITARLSVGTDTVGMQVRATMSATGDVIPAPRALLRGDFRLYARAAETFDIAAHLRSVTKQVATAVQTHNATLELRSKVTVVADGIRHLFVEPVAFKATSTLAASGSVAIVGGSTLTATATVTAEGQRRVPGQANLRAVSAVVADALRTAIASTALRAVVALSAKGVVTVHGNAALKATATLSANGVAGPVGQAPHSSTATLTAKALHIHNGSAALTAKAVLSGKLAIIANLAGVLQAKATISATGLRIVYGDSALQARATLRGDLSHALALDADLLVQARLHADALRTAVALSALVARARVRPTALVHRFAAAQLVVVATLNAHGQPAPIGSGGITAIATVSGDLIYVAHIAGAQLRADATLHGTSSQTHASKAVLKARCRLTASGFIAPYPVVYGWCDLRVDATLAADGDSWERVVPLPEWPEQELVGAGGWHQRLNFDW